PGGNAHDPGTKPSPTLHGSSCTDRGLPRLGAASGGILCTAGASARRRRSKGVEARFRKRYQVRGGAGATGLRAPKPERARMRGRSEEHTSELQSREKLVCRLLLEKKKQQKTEW